MTDVSDAVRDDVADRDGEAGTTAPPPPPAAAETTVARRRGTALLAGLTAMVAVLCGALLPFAPVSVNEPTLTWPQDPARPESTLLQLASYRPLAMDIRFSCEVAALAQDRGGLVLSTAAPASPVAAVTGLVVTARDGRLQVAGMDRVLLDEPVAAGPCGYRITGESLGKPSFQGEPPPPGDPTAPDPDVLAGPDNAEVVISRDGTELARTDVPQLPDVDVLATSLTAVPPGSLSVELRVDDEFAASPTPVKQALVIGLLVALLGTALLLARLDTGTARVPALWRPGWPRLVDLVVPAVLVLWLFIAPATDDDGYYAAMARNSALTGDVGNYYQLYDQSFTPFTWFYQALGFWQGFAGDAAVQQRIPALVFGILTFLALRRVVALAMQEWAADRPRTRALAAAVLAVTYLAWWLPQDMGVRPETVVALTGALTLLAVLAAARRRRLSLAWLAFLVAGVGFTAHPTGFTLFAPLLAGLPLLWPLIRVTGDRLGTAARAFAVASGGMIAMGTAFADGSLRDFLRGQAIFLSIQPQDGWTNEIQRYSFLLNNIPMGNYAKRSAILVCLVALVWFAVLAAAARLREVTLPTPLWYAASTTALAFGALWLTPSKWSHHFGSLAGVGPVFLALFLVTAVPLTRKVLGHTRVPVGVLAAAATSFLVAIALAWHGPNQWPYAWLDGMHRPEYPPAISTIALDSPALWVLGFALLAVATTLLARRAGEGGVRLGVLRAVPLVVVVSLIGTTGYLLGTFTLAAVQGVPRESLWAQSWVDPTGANCGSAAAVRVYDPDTAVPLAPLSAAPITVAAGEPGRAPNPVPPSEQDPAYAQDFVTGGYYVGNAPQGSGAEEVWGSLLGRDGRSLEENTGRMSTGWYALPPDIGPDADPDSAVTVLAAGTLEDANTLTAVYGRSADGTTVTRVGEEDLRDSARDPAWRTFVLAPPPGADRVRLEAADTAGGLHGWMAFTAPARAVATVLVDYIPDAAPVALGWPIAFNYPCLRQPTMVNGVTESPEYAVLWGNRALSGFADGVWQPFRGGAFAQVPRTQSVQQLAVVPGVDPRLEVYSFATPLARDAYSLTRTRRTVSGADISVRE